ncbi:MAG: hypothetical protein JXR76_04625 [Deltaproteobacteria bacterium]|nr:hypothetical protein [Deltaproteobacteria bacterium]
MSDVTIDSEYDDETTTEMTREQTQRLVKKSVAMDERATLPEIPFNKLTGMRKTLDVKGSIETPSHAKAGDSAASDQEGEIKTDPGVYIKVGSEKVVWVEAEKTKKAPDEDTGIIVG